MTKTEILKDIKKFTELENNWDGYGAVPIGILSYENAMKIINYIPLQFIEQIDDIGPNTNGTLTIDWKLENKEISLEIGDEYFSYYVLLSPRDDMTYQEYIDSDKTVLCNNKTFDNDIEAFIKYFK